MPYRCARPGRAGRVPSPTAAVHTKPDQHTRTRPVREELPASNGHSPHTVPHSGTPGPPIVPELDPVYVNQVRNVKWVGDNFARPPSVPDMTYNVFKPYSINQSLFSAPHPGANGKLPPPWATNATADTSKPCCCDKQSVGSSLIQNAKHLLRVMTRSGHRSASLETLWP